MKKLSICIPTYNRTQSLLKLSKEFLIPALDLYSDVIEISVSDNSDQKNAEKNKKLLDSRIHYYKNKGNIGYSGNIRRCIEIASSEYLWIIADDDTIIFDGFKKLIEMLDTLNNKPDVLFTPVKTRNIHKETVMVNDQADWQCEQDCFFMDILLKGKLPFLFIAGAVIKNNFYSVKYEEIINIENDYLHALLYCSSLKNESRVRFLEHSLVEYGTNSNAVQFSVLSISNSINFIINFIKENFSIKINTKTFYSEHLKWLLYHRVGISKIFHGDRDRLKVISKLSKHFTIRNMMKCFALLLPRKLLKVFFVFYYTKKRMSKGKKRSLKFFKSTFADYWKSI